MIGYRVDDVRRAEPIERCDDRVTQVRVCGIESLDEDPAVFAERPVPLVERDGLRRWRGVQCEHRGKPRTRRVEEPCPLWIGRARVCLDGKGRPTLEGVIG